MGTRADWEASRSPVDRTLTRQNVTTVPYCGRYSKPPGSFGPKSSRRKDSCESRQPVFSVRLPDAMMNWVFNVFSKLRAP